MSYLQRQLNYVSMQSLVSLRDHCHQTRGLPFSTCILAPFCSSTPPFHGLQHSLELSWSWCNSQSTKKHFFKIFFLYCPFARLMNWISSQWSPQLVQSMQQQPVVRSGKEKGGKKEGGVASPYRSWGDQRDLLTLPQGIFSLKSCWGHMRHANWKLKIISYKNLYFTNQK